MKNTFTTDDGLVVEYGVVSMEEMTLGEAGLEAEYRERGEPLDPPTYQVPVAGGDLQTFQHTAETLEVEDDPAQTAINRSAWAAHTLAKARLLAEQTGLRNSFIFDAIKVEIPADGSWEARCKRMHIRLPDDPFKRREMCITTYVLKTINDMTLATQKIMANSMKGVVSEEAIAAQMRLFRGQLQEAANVTFRDRNSAGGTADGAGALESQRKAKRSSRRKKLGPDTEPIPDAQPVGPGGDDGA